MPCQALEIKLIHRLSFYEEVHDDNQAMKNFDFSHSVLIKLRYVFHLAGHD